jgi:hypothetical protein
LEICQKNVCFGKSTIYIEGNKEGAWFCRMD